MISIQKFINETNFGIKQPIQSWYPVKQINQIIINTNILTSMWSYNCILHPYVKYVFYIYF